jgi:cholesterol oxidase
MSRLAAPIGLLQSHYPVVVVGSGYGGAIAAARLARAGIEVCVLERGREFQPGDYPNDLPQALRELQVDFPEGHRFSPTGLYDLRVNDDLNVILGCGLGGTSLINAGVALTPQAPVLEDPRWPRAIRTDPLALEQGYRAARDMLRPAPYPDDLPALPKLAAVDTIHRQLPGAPAGRPGRLDINVNFTELPGARNHVGVRQSVCVGCGDCMSGCNFQAKSTLIMNYLPEACAHRARLFTGVTVRSLQPVHGAFGRRWVIHYQLAGSGRDRFGGPELFLTAERVVLAAGSLGSTEILARSCRRHGLALSPALGAGFTGNGDVLAFGYNGPQPVHGIGFGPRRPDPWRPVGPCAAAIIDLRPPKGSADWRQGIVIEEGAITGALGRIISAGLLAGAFLVGEPTGGHRPRSLERDGRGLARQLWGGGAARHTFVFLIMGHDEGRGRLELRDDRIRVHWPGAARQAIFERVRAHVRAASRALGAVYLPNPLRLITAHPLGGCVMADDADAGVVNDTGRVFRPGSPAATSRYHEGLYVWDGSIVPSPLGVNPLLTIAALAERAVARMLRE